MAVDNNNLIWIDLEMTGLDPDQDRVIELATIVTNASLAIVAEGPVIAIRQPDVVLEAMDSWNLDTHTNSGLIDRVRESEYDESAASAKTIAFLRRHVEPGNSPMCGNSVCQDRRFLYRWMPELERYFHYRNLDVSSVKELCNRWAPQIAQGLKKKSTHQALQDIRDSIDELRYYREHFFNVNR
ncbi:MAG: oligoribonuclease [Gammaproteobacteria bacterium]|nr:oligoribonuclease [Gammaproteobacteria bacterium]MDH3412642.1 oligoribonuclease [Gammaproteobacteria bacterium]